MADSSFAWYLEKLGYHAVQQGDNGFRVICREGKPIGFLTSEGELLLVGGEEQEESILNGAAAFVREYGGLTPVGDREYLLGSYLESKLTVFYSMERKKARYAVYRPSGESALFDARETAALAFLDGSGLAGFIPRRRIPPRERLRRWLLRRLMKSEGTGKEETGCVAHERR